MTVAKQKVNKGEEKRIQGIKVERLLINKAPLEDVEGKCVIFFSICSQTVKDGGGYNLCNIEKSDKKGKYKDPDEQGFGPDYFYAHIFKLNANQCCIGSYGLL